MIGTHVREVQRVPELVQEGVPVGLAAVRTQHEIDLFGHAHRRAEGARALPFALARVEDDAAVRLRIDAHLRDLAPDGRLHVARRKELVELTRAKERERVGARRLAQLHAEHALRDARRDVVPHRLRVAQERLALRRAAPLSEMPLSSSQVAL